MFRQIKDNGERMCDDDGEKAGTYVLEPKILRHLSSLPLPLAERSSNSEHFS